MKFVGLAALLAWSVPAPVPAQLLNPPVTFLSTADIALIARYEQALGGIMDPAKALVVVEQFRALPGLSAKQAAMFANLHGNILLGLGRTDEAKALAKVVAERGSTDPMALLAAADLYYEASDVIPVAELLTTASRLQPDIVQLVDPYAFVVLFNQLDDMREEKRSDALARRLFDAGWDRGVTNLRSALAMDVIASLLASGEIEASRSYVPYVVRPADFAKLMTEKRFAALRLSAEAWAGVRVEKQWPIYLGQVRADYVRARTPEAGADYVGALLAAGHDQTMIDTFVPRLNLPLDQDRDELWLLVVPAVVDSLAQVGRWDDAFALLDKMAKVWPEGHDANAINISANRAKLRLMHGDFQQASNLFERALEEAKPFEVEVTIATMYTLRAYKACADHRLGRPDAMPQADLVAEHRTRIDPGTVSWMWLCLGQRDKAKQVWLSALVDPIGQARLVSYIQPRTHDSKDSPFSREMERAISDLATDPSLVAAGSRFGILRSWRLAESAPPDPAGPTKPSLPQSR